ncbi:MAG: CoA transferase, partial [Hyphomicrobiaceae bacterium]
ARVANRAETDRIVGECFASHGTQAMIDLLNKADIAYGRVSDFDTLLAHPHLRRMSIETPNGPVLLPESAAQIKDEPRTYGPTPALGAHDAAVRAEFLEVNAPKA